MVKLETPKDRRRLHIGSFFVDLNETDYQELTNIFGRIAKNISSKPVLATGWIPVEELPTGSMKVKWFCEDGVEDVGFYYSEQKEFASWDLCSEKPITHWKSLEPIQPACS